MIDKRHIASEIYGTQPLDIHNITIHIYLQIESRLILSTVSREMSDRDCIAGAFIIDKFGIQETLRQRKNEVSIIFLIGLQFEMKVFPPVFCAIKFTKLQ